MKRVFCPKRVETKGYFETCVGGAVAAAKVVGDGLPAMGSVRVMPQKRVWPQENDITRQDTTAQPTQLALVQLRMDPYIQKLYDLLLQLRSKLCNESSFGLMPYMIFPSSELMEIATRMLTTLAQLQACGLISQKKIWKFGPPFVSLISEFVALNPPARLLRYQALTEPTD